MISFLPISPHPLLKRRKRNARAKRPRTKNKSFLVVGFLQATRVALQKAHDLNSMNRYLTALVCLSAFVLFVACGGEEPTDTPPTTVPTLAPTDAPTGTAARATATLAAQSTEICA